MSRLHQTDADHSWGVAIIILKLNPNASKELIAQAIVHDSGEKWAGDLSHPFKRMHPEISKAHSAAEHALAVYHKIPQFVLTPEEQKWLSFADRLECHLYAEIYYPWITKQESWVRTMEQMKVTAQELGITKDIFAPVENLFT
jgi:5'-deoxynucleotidase YfbR-like HD superfamily hydrolase